MPRVFHWHAFFRPPGDILWARSPAKALFRWGSFMREENTSNYGMFGVRSSAEFPLSSLSTATARSPIWFAPLLCLWLNLINGRNILRRGSPVLSPGTALIPADLNSANGPRPHDRMD